MRHEIPALATDAESRPRQRLAHLAGKLAQPSNRPPASGPDQMVVRPETELVDVDGERCNANTGCGGCQFGQTRFGNVAEEGQRQVDGVAPGGAAAEGQGSCLGDVAKALGNFR